MYNDSKYAIKNSMIVTVDTNVLLQATSNINGASGFILRLIRSGDVRLALSHAVLSEYQDVIQRPYLLQKMRIGLDEAADMLNLIAQVGEPFSIFYRWRPNLRDEADNMFVELAVHSQSLFLITNNIKDFTIAKDLKFDSFRVITPANFVRMWKLL